jgi:hypothetical protein
MSNLRTICLLVASLAAIIGVNGLRAGATGRQAVRAQPATDAIKQDAAPTDLIYPQVYVASDGETHFRDVRVPLTAETTAPPAQPIAQSVPQPATTIRHAAFPPHWGVHDREHDIFHNASGARFITIRRGVIWIKVSDGETRRFQAGDVVEVLDVAPSRGHITWTGDEPVLALFSNHP